MRREIESVCVCVCVFDRDEEIEKKREKEKGRMKERGMERESLSYFVYFISFYFTLLYFTSGT